MPVRRSSFRPVPVHFAPPSSHMLLWCRHHTAYSIHLPVLCFLRILASRLILLHSPVACFRLSSVWFFARLFFCPLLPCCVDLACSLAKDAVGLPLAWSIQYSSD